ncbi:MAG: Glu/Leu/Phe/Val dehydrogenase dimerization domain-containing protein [Candidatus Eisenbacteria bacterium]
MDIFEALGELDHEQVSFAFDEAAGLRGIVAIHNTVLGPAIGGTRMREYASEDEALEDALRLSAGMTYKAAAAGLNFGGGAVVVMGDPTKDKTELLFRALGRHIDSLNGRYITSQGLGTDVEDMQCLRLETEHVVGLHSAYGGCGDPAPVMAHGAICGMRACLEEIGAAPSIRGLKVAVQGLGRGGTELARQLMAEGASVVGSDPNPEAAENAKSLGVSIVEPDAIYDAECDVWSPSAVGEILNDDTIPRLRCRIVAGPANSQLKEPGHAAMLAERGILYAPDFVFNSGALIAVTEEIAGYSFDRAMRRAEDIYTALKKVFALARERGMNTAEAANAFAEARIRQLGALSGGARG